MDDAIDWVSRAADAVEERVAPRGPATRIVCASGISPSGPIHLGNLREAMTTHLVVEELRRRGRDAEHLHSWDDFDRLRKVPAGIDPRFEQYVGQPIARVPDPLGEHDSWATRFIAEFEDAAERMGLRPRWVRQSRAYPAGAYRQGIRRALDARLDIFDILARYQTEKLQDRPLEERRQDYWPLTVYCTSCGHDHTAVQAWDPASSRVDYRCTRCGPRHFLLDEECPAKLVWKADWPMRWAHEGVDFEPGGEDHSTPGGSFTVGTEIVDRVYGGRAPHYIGYGFVGMSGRTKLSSSAGTNATPEFALRFIEPAILRWLYVRRRVDRKFTIDFGAEIWRCYDEWDALVARAASLPEGALERLELRRARLGAAGPVPEPALPVPFRLLSSAADMTHGNVEQILRIVRDHLDTLPDGSLEAALEPRLGCAIGWATLCLPDDERVHVREAFGADAWEALDDEQRAAVAVVAERMDGAWTLRGLDTLVYGAPKLVRGLPVDAPPDAELKRFQRRVFIALYQLLLGADTGPRLPTLLLSLGPQKVGALLRPPAA
jgi:lysyl-tRNA synthetase, class I